MDYYSDDPLENIFQLESFEKTCSYLTRYYKIKKLNIFKKWKEINFI